MGNHAFAGCASPCAALSKLFPSTPIARNCFASTRSFEKKTLEPDRDPGATPTVLVTRSVFGFIPVVGILLQFLDNLWMIWDGKKQTWHDKAAGTYVVRR